LYICGAGAGIHLVFAGAISRTRGKLLRPFVTSGIRRHFSMAQESRVKKKRTRNPVATRAKLLQATIELITEKGAAALSLKEAALRANVSRGVAYMHFEDREQLLNEAKVWISEGLQEGIQRFGKAGSLHDRTFYNTKLVLSHPEAAKLMITAAMAGTDLAAEHPLHKLVLNMLKELKANGKVRADIDLEIMTSIMFGSIASTIMLGEQRKGDDLDELAERFTREWSRILRDGIFVKGAGRKGVSRRAPPKQVRM
jgi:AcrR family transcriptional regulator